MIALALFRRGIRWTIPRPQDSPEGIAVVRRMPWAWGGSGVRRG